MLSTKALHIGGCKMAENKRPTKPKKVFTIVVRITEKQNNLLIDYCKKNNCNTTEAIENLINSLDK